MAFPETVSTGLLYPSGREPNFLEPITTHLDATGHTDYRRVDDDFPGSTLRIYDDVSVDIHVFSGGAVDGRSHCLEVSTGFRSFYNRDDDSERLQQYLGFVRDAYRLTDPVYGFGFNRLLLSEYGSDPIPTLSDDGIEDPHIEQPAWIMLFSPPLVDHYGLEWLESLPVEYTERLANGGLLVVANTDAGDAFACGASMEALESIFAERR